MAILIIFNIIFLKTSFYSFAHVFLNYFQCMQYFCKLKNTYLISLPFKSQIYFQLFTVTLFSIRLAACQQRALTIISLGDLPQAVAF